MNWRDEFYFISKNTRNKISIYRSLSEIVFRNTYFAYRSILPGTVLDYFFFALIYYNPN